MLILPTRNNIVSREKPTWAVSDIVTLSATAYEFDAKYFAVDHVEYHPQGIYVDNTQGASAVRIQVNGVNYTWVVPIGSMGRVAIPAPYSAGSIYMTGGGPTPITFVDYPIVPGIDWPNGQPVNVTFPATQNVDVLNFPANQVVSGTVNVGNFPATQNVDVVNFPASQTVNGAVSVSNFPATQPISGNVGITGSVNVISSDYLTTESNGSFIVAFNIGPTAGDIPSIQLVNPLGSGKKVVITKLVYDTSSASNFILCTATQLANIYANGTNKNLGQPVSISTSYTQTARPTVAAYLIVFTAIANQFETLTFDPPLIMSAGGFGLCAFIDSAGANLEGYFEFQEM